MSSLQVTKAVTAAPVLTLSKSASSDDVNWVQCPTGVSERQRFGFTTNISSGEAMNLPHNTHLAESSPPPHRESAEEEGMSSGREVTIEDAVVSRRKSIVPTEGNIALPEETRCEPNSLDFTNEQSGDDQFTELAAESSEISPGLTEIIAEGEHVTLPLPNILVNGHARDTEERSDSSASRTLQAPRVGHERHFSNMFGMQSRQVSINLNHPERRSVQPKIDLYHKSHVDIFNKGNGFNVHDTCYHATVARNWPNSRKRFTAVIVCTNTACIGLLLGIYAGEVPAIQYAIADLSHYTILGNVVMYVGMAISVLLFWPLPLLHGRKPYIIAAQICALALQLPQGLAVASFRDPGTALYRTLLLSTRGLSGLVLGFVDINLKATLLDLFGASLQSRGTFSDPLAAYDVRKHGGGMGLWLGVLAWCNIGPISIGFMVGTSIINQGASVSWGFWISLIVLMFTLLLNIVTPEVRRSAFRRTISEMIGVSGGFSRVTRGEVKMHVDSTGPYWWYEEVSAGLRLCGRMMLQPGFIILAIYTGWIYAQYSLVLMLLGALASRHYKYTPAYVGTCSLALALGAILATPFQKASALSRARTQGPRSDSFTMQTKFQWSSHLVRRLLFMVLLPLSAAAYAGASLGPPLSIAVPCTMAGMVGFFTTMATAECYGLIMETFDTTDLQPGMTGRPLRGSVDETSLAQRTNFSCYPRVSAAFVITQVISYVLAAAATAVCGRVERREGTVWATTGVATILFALTLLLSLVLVKWKKVQMIPDGAETDLAHLRRVGTSWRPVVLGRATGKYRRLSILEMGRMTRFSEIRQRNRLEGHLSGGVRP